MQTQHPHRWQISTRFRALWGRRSSQIIGLIPVTIVLLISATAALPFIWHGLPQSFDAPIHLARLGALDQALRQGELYPRWLPDLLLGHGYPVFNYYAPASYYLAVGLLRLGANAYGAYSGTFALLFLVAGVGMYRWARDLYGREIAAILAAVAYAFSPYLLLNAYIRGSLAEVCAQALLPWLFWAFRRLMLAERPAVYVPLAALTLGGIAVSHNITLLFVPPVLLAYLVVLGLKTGFTSTTRGSVVVSLLLAMGISAFFWLPVLAERDLLSNTGYAIARDGWLPANIWQWNNFLQTTLAYTYNFTRPVQVGIMQSLLALVGFVLAVGKPNRDPQAATRRSELWLLGGVALVASALVGAWALPIWQSSEILTLVQFPWRLLTIVSLPMALAVGGLTYGIQQRWGQVVVGTSVLMLIVWAHYPRLEQIPVYDAQSMAITPDRIAQIEQYKGAEEGGENTSSVQEFKPRWVARNLVLETPGETIGETTESVDNTTEPAELEIRVDQSNDWEKEVTVDAQAATMLRFNQFYFPGWELQSDAGVGALYPSTNLGLLTTQLTPGSQTISLGWRGTGVQHLSVGITLVALALLTAWCWASGLRQGWLIFSLTLLGVGLVATFYQPQPNVVQQPEQQLMGEGIELVGLRYEQSDPDHLDIFPIWFVSAPLPADLEVRWQVVDAQGTIVLDWSGQPFYNSYSADNFPAQTLVDDSYRLALPAGMRAGIYTLRAQIVGATAPLTPLVDVSDVTLPNATSAPPMPSHALAARFEAGILLNGYDLQPTPAQSDAGQSNGEQARAVPVVMSGERVEITLWWQADPPPDQNYHGFVHLVDNNGLPVAQVDQLPGPLFQPPMLWNAERPAPDVYTLTIAEETPSGLYWPWVGLYEFATQRRLNVEVNETQSDHLQLPPIKVVNQQEMPPSAVEVAVNMGDFARWIGYELDSSTTSVQPGQSLHLTLYYESITSTATGYTRFVHVVHPTDGLITQADSVPAHGANPSWSWQPGEIISDPVTIAFPPNAPAGEYELYVGFYAPEAGGLRLPLQSDEAGRVQNGDQAAILRVTVTD